MTPLLLALMALALLLVVLSSPAAAAEGPQHAQGSGTWGPGDDQAPANATFLLIDQDVASFRVDTHNGTTIVCHDGRGIKTTIDGQGTNGDCAGNTTNGRVQLSFIHDGPTPDQSKRNETGVFTIDHAITLPHPAQEPTSWAGILLLTAAIASTAATAVLIVLLVRERRLTTHLARRLWEKSRSKNRDKHPESLESEKVKRILVRSKN
jgi:hypothetical protein